MPRLPISFKEANRYLGSILGTGFALGLGNYALGNWPNLGQSLVQQVSISLVIGYGIMLVVFNSAQWLKNIHHEYQEIALLTLLFIFIALLGTEVLILVERFLFLQGKYAFFSGGGIYLFNIILTCVLGFSTRMWVKASLTNTPGRQEPEPVSAAPEFLSQIPVKQKDVISFYPVKDIIYFEAYDNYAFLYMLDGEKHLCNYSLRFLEERLDPSFLRVHRKYLINRNHIHQIKPFVKGRYLIIFKDKNQSSIHSSSTYSEALKSLIRL